MFGSIVYNRTTVYIHQNFLKVVVHLIISDQLYEIQVTIIYSPRFSCHFWRQSAVFRGLSVKPELEHWQTVQT